MKSDSHVVLVTGASGLLGANMVAVARQKGLRVIAAFNQHLISVPGVQSVQVDLNDFASVTQLVHLFRPQWIIHCAAVTNVDWCETHAQVVEKLHVDASRNLAIAAEKNNGQLVYISTDSVFDGLRGDYSEDDFCRPMNVYASTKLTGERAVLDILESSLIVRTNIYGWNMQNKQSLAEWILYNLQAHSPINGFCDVIFTPILVNDLADLLLEMLASQLAGIYHIGASQACSKYEFALSIADVFSLDRDLICATSIEDSRLQAARAKNTSLQTRKIVHAMNGPMPDIMMGLHRFKALLDSGYATKLKTFGKGH